MSKLKVVQKDYNNYLLKDNKEKEYNFVLNFDDIEECNFDYIYMSQELLDENYKEYNKTYSFGKVNSKYARKLSEKTIQDLIIIQKDDEVFYLQKYYG